MSARRNGPETGQDHTAVRRMALDDQGRPIVMEDVVLDDDEFGGILDTYGFPAFIGAASIVLVSIYAIVIANTLPHLLADHFVSLTVCVALCTMIPLSLVASMRERRKWRSHSALRSIASLDPLTGLMNRRAFSVSIEEELSRMQRTKQSAAVILFDLDHFKRLNDTHGHHVGDEVLVQVAALAYAELRNPFDRLARWGGEEFIILLHNMSEETATVVSERLRQRIAQLTVQYEGGVVTPTASFGGSLVSPDQTFSEALNKADDALYTAKSKGRNRVEFRRTLSLAA